MANRWLVARSRIATARKVFAAALGCAVHAAQALGGHPAPPVERMRSTQGRIVRRFAPHPSLPLGAAFQAFVAVARPRHGGAQPAARKTKTIHPSRRPGKQMTLHAFAAVRQQATIRALFPSCQQKRPRRYSACTHSVEPSAYSVGIKQRLPSSTHNFAR
jgi:hypothetical protein